MNIIRVQYNDIELIGGYQFWSNPTFFNTESAIPIVLCRPTLIDLIRLSVRYGINRLKTENDTLFNLNQISIKAYERNVFHLTAIENGLKNHVPKDIDIAIGSSKIPVNKIKLMSRLAKSSTNRIKSRDFFDIYYLVKVGEISIEDVIAGMKTINSVLTYEGCLYRLLNMPLRSNDEGLHDLKIDISFSEIREFFAKEIMALEENMTMRTRNQFSL